MKIHRRNKIRRSSQKNSYVFFLLALLTLLSILYYRNISETVLGISTGGSDEGETVPTESRTPTTAIFPTSPPSFPRVTDVPPTPPGGSYEPTPTPITPQDPIYVPVVTPTPSSTFGGIPQPTESVQQPVSQPPVVNIADPGSTVVIEYTPTGITTTSEQLDAVTIASSPQTAAAVEALQQEQSVVQRFLALFSGTSQTSSTANPSGTSLTTAPLYQQVYIPGVNKPTYSTEPTKTLDFLTLWLGYNNLKITPYGTNRFIIYQGEDAAVTNATDSKIAVNLSRMEILVNTPSGFKQLSFLPSRVIQYVKDLNVISTVNEVLAVSDTQSGLVYMVKGTSSQYFLAFIPMNISKEVCVMARTNEVCGVNQSPISKMLDMLSI